MKKDITKEKNWSIVKSEYLFNRPWLTVRKDCIRLPDGRENPEFYVLEYPDWVNVIAITEDGKYIMEKQYRHGLGITEYELCAGVIEQGETPLEAAKRELSEETGYGEGEWSEFMQICGNPSCTNNITHCFIAKNVKKISEQHLDKTEDITPILLDIKDIKTILKEDLCKQALMVAPLWRYFAENDLI